MSGAIGCSNKKREDIISQKYPFVSAVYFSVWKPLSLIQGRAPLNNLLHYFQAGYSMIFFERAGHTLTNEDGLDMWRHASADVLWGHAALFGTE